MNIKCVCMIILRPASQLLTSMWKVTLMELEMDYKSTVIDLEANNSLPK